VTPVAARALLQRRCACGGTPGPDGGCSACKARRLQRQAAGAGPRIAPPIVHDVLHSPGRPLEPAARAQMEARFGHDFSQVRVHTDAMAAESARAVSAAAYTVGRNVVFAGGRYRPDTAEGRSLVAHELAHVVQQGCGGGAGGALPVADAGGPAEAEAQAAAGGPVRVGGSSSPPSVQRRLEAVRTAATTTRPDPAAALTDAQRFAMADTYIRALCDDFAVDQTTGQVVPVSGRTGNRHALAAGSKPTGCCCLAVLDDSPTNTWGIEISAVKSARTFGRLITLPATNVPLDSGSWTAAGALAFQGLVATAGHELCGHAALIELGAHPAGGSRLTTDVHDPTVRIESAISTEQGVPSSELRGLAASGPHRGESVDRITVREFPFNGVDPAALPAAEHDKLEFAADYVVQNRAFVDVVGHSDPVGSTAAKQLVSDQRADNTRTFLAGRGVTGTVQKDGLTFPRFTRVEGVADREPPAGGSAVPHGQWRRVDLLVANFPAGTQRPPAGTPTAVTPHTRAAGLTSAATSPDPCVALLARTGYPLAGVGDFPERVLPPGEEAA
jgi:Domain of unknown function (DUF4157)